MYVAVILNEPYYYMEYTCIKACNNMSKFTLTRNFKAPLTSTCMFWWLGNQKLYGSTVRNWFHLEFPIQNLGRALEFQGRSGQSDRVAVNLPMVPLKAFIPRPMERDRIATREKGRKSEGREQERIVSLMGSLGGQSGP